MLARAVLAKDLCLNKNHSTFERNFAILQNMSWAGKRQITYLGGLFLFIGLVLFGLFYNVIFVDPNCHDGKQNGDEVGIDCGGLCSRMCMSQVSEPVVLWSRAFKVVDNTYNLLAYVENQNKTGAVQTAPYEFRVYDENGILIAKREGTTFIPANQRFAVFESRIDAGNSTPKSVTFQFNGPFTWYHKAPTIQTQPIRIEKKELNDSDPSSPVLSAQVVNDSVYDLPAFDVIAILYDENSNAIAVSKTHRDGVASNSKSNISFTWPSAFTGNPVVRDLLLSVDPFTTPF